MTNGAYASGWTGRLTRDLDVRTSAAGKVWVTAGVAVNNREKDYKSEEWVDNTVFFELKAFGNLAENINESNGIGRGSEIAFSGKIKSETWKDKEGKDRTSISIVLDSFAVELSHAQITGVNAVRGKSASGPSTPSSSAAPSSITRGEDQEGSSFFGGSGSSKDDNPFG